MYLEKIKLRLKSLGYEVTNEDAFALEFVMGKVDQYIKHFCNIDEVPECLEYPFIELCVSDFMISKMSMGKLESMELEQVVKTIEDGDTTVSFQSGMDANTRFVTYFNSLAKTQEQSLLRHRKLVW